MRKLLHISAHLVYQPKNVRLTRSSSLLVLTSLVLSALPMYRPTPKTYKLHIRYRYAHVPQIYAHQIFCHYYRPRMRGGNGFILCVCLSVYVSVHTDNSQVMYFIMNTLTHVLKFMNLCLRLIYSLLLITLMPI